MPAQLLLKAILELLFNLHDIISQLPNTNTLIMAKPLVLERVLQNKFQSLLHKHIQLSPYPICLHKHELHKLLVFIQSKLWTSNVLYKLSYLKSCLVYEGL